MQGHRAPNSNALLYVYVRKWSRIRQLHVRQIFFFAHTSAIDAYTSLFCDLSSLWYKQPKLPICQKLVAHTSHLVACTSEWRLTSLTILPKSLPHRVAPHTDLADIITPPLDTPRLGRQSKPPISPPQVTPSPRGREHLLLPIRQHSEHLNLTYRQPSGNPTNGPCTSIWEGE